jgi:hypothetical protein
VRKLPACRLICRFHQITDFAFRITLQLLNRTQRKINSFAISVKFCSVSGILHGIFTITNKNTQQRSRKRKIFFLLKSGQSFFTVILFSRYDSRNFIQQQKKAAA